MRLVIIHDEHGAITSLAATSPDDPPIRKALEAGEYATELEMPEISPDLGHEEIMRRLLTIADNYRVEDPSAAPRLTKKR
jgi:hypothetical protein